MPSDSKPRYRFCWRCSNKLQGNAHRVVVIDGHERVVHVQCNLTTHDNDECEFCGDPVPVLERFCSQECANEFRSVGGPAEDAHDDDEPRWPA